MNYEEFYESEKFRIGNGKGLELIGASDIIINVYDGNKWTRKHLKDVKYIPNIKYNLLSLNATTKNSMEFISNNDLCEFVKDRQF